MTTYDDPDAFVAGTVGEPGRRVFYLQARAGSASTSIKLEKQQVLALAEYLAGLLHDLPVPEAAAPAVEFVDPVIEHWTVGTIGVAYDNDRDRIVIVAEELVPDGETGESLQVAVTRAQVRALINEAEVLMEGGRPPCRLCGAPLDPTGHACPRSN